MINRSTTQGRNKWNWERSEAGLGNLLVLMGSYKCHWSYINLNVSEQDDGLYATSNLAKQN